VELLAARSTLKLEDHPLSAVRDYLFTIFAATLHVWRPSPPSVTLGQSNHQGRGLIVPGYYKFVTSRKHSTVLFISLKIKALNFELKTPKVAENISTYMIMSSTSILI